MIHLIDSDNDPTVSERLEELWRQSRHGRSVQEFVRFRFKTLGGESDSYAIPPGGHVVATRPPLMPWVKRLMIYKSFVTREQCPQEPLKVIDIGKVVAVMYDTPHQRPSGSTPRPQRHRL
jgi:hypothetical protein